MTVGVELELGYIEWDIDGFDDAVGEDVEVGLDVGENVTGRFEGAEVGELGCTDG